MTFKITIPAILYSSNPSINALRDDGGFLANKTNLIYL